MIGNQKKKLQLRQKLQLFDIKEALLSLCSKGLYCEEGSGLSVKMMNGLKTQVSLAGAFKAL